MKKRLSCSGLAQVKHECTTVNLQANIKTWSGNMSLPRARRFKSVPSVSKVMLTLFWDLNGPIVNLYQDHSQ